MAFLIDQLNNSGLFAQSAYSAGIANTLKFGAYISADSGSYIRLGDWEGEGPQPGVKTKSDFGYTKINGPGFFQYNSASNYSIASIAYGLNGSAGYIHQQNRLNMPLTTESVWDADRLTFWISTAGTTADPISQSINFYDISAIKNSSGKYAAATNYVQTNSAKINKTAETVQNNSATWNTVTDKLDTTAFSDVSGTFLTAHQPISAEEWNSSYETVQTNSASWGQGGGAGDMSASKLDYATQWDDVGNPFYTISGYDGSAFSLGSFYVTNSDSIFKNGGDSLIEINDTGIRLDNPDGGYSEQSSFYGGDYFHIGSYSNPSAYIEGYANGRIELYDANHISGRLDVSSISSWNDVHNTVQTNSASWGGGSTYTGDAQGALDEVYSNSGDWNDVYATVYNNSGSWTGGGGGSIDTIPFIVQSPLTTGISGYSAYIGLDGESFESSAYVPFSALTDNDMYDGYVHLINGSGVYAVDASHSNYADYAYYDSNGNDLATTRYYADEAYNTVQSNSANWSGGGSTPVSGLELSAGEYITIVDDIPNSASIISVTGLATTGDLNYVSGVVGDVESLLAQL